MINSGMVPEGAYHNLRFFEGKTEFPDGFAEEKKLVLSDPQTSGGLLIAVKEEGLRVFEKSGVFFAVIGRVSAGSGNVKVH